jgi:uncharacterized membrane protein YbhN (UPF0104 family)
MDTPGLTPMRPPGRTERSLSGAAQVPGTQAPPALKTSVAAFAFVGLLTALPITPGGAGITELGLVGTLAAGAGPSTGAQVTAAVLLYRAVTYLPPSPSAQPPTSSGNTHPR